MPYKDLLSNN